MKTVQNSAKKCEESRVNVARSGALRGEASGDHKEDEAAQRRLGRGSKLAAVAHRGSVLFGTSEKKI